MGKYTTVQALWDSFGEGVYTKVRGESIGTGAGGEETFSFDRDKLISGSTVIYSAGTAISSSLYSLDLDDGSVTLTTGASTAYTADYNYGTMPDSHMQGILDKADEELETVTGRKFNVNTTSEYIDIEEGQDSIWLKHYPVTSITSLSTNTAETLQDSPVWIELVEGLGNDYLQEQDEEKRLLTIIDAFPKYGKQRVKVDYVYGYSTIPDLVEELNILLAQKKMLNSGIYKSVVQGDNFTEAELAELNNRITKLTNLLGKKNVDKI